MRRVIKIKPRLGWCVGSHAQERTQPSFMWGEAAYPRGALVVLNTPTSVSSFDPHTNP